MSPEILRPLITGATLNCQISERNLALCFGCKRQRQVSGLKTVFSNYKNSVGHVQRGDTNPPGAPPFVQVNLNSFK